MKKQLLTFLLLVTSLTTWAQSLYQANALAAMRGDAEAQVNVAVAYVFGDGIDINYAQAVQWLQKAVAQGNARGLYMMGVMYEEGKGVPQNQIKASEYYLKSAKQEFVEAQFKIGYNYLYAKGCSSRLRARLLLDSKGCQ